MKAKLKLFFILLIILFSSCDKTDDAVNPKKINGVWVHSETQTDTIDFNSVYSFSENMFNLKRGKEIRDGHTLPKLGSDSYEYEIIGDSIYVIGMLWSCRCKQAYYFKMNKDEKSFLIGNIAPFTGGLLFNEFKRIN